MKQTIPDRSALQSVTGLPRDITLDFLRRNNIPYDDKHTFSQDQCTALHDVYDLQNLNVDRLESLKLAVTFEAFEKSGIEITGSIRARVHQTCVVTLEPLARTISEDVSQFYLPQHKLKAWFDDHPNLEDTLIDETPPDLLPDTFDLTQVAMETLLLGIDPHARKFDAEPLNINVTPPGATPLTEDSMKPLAGLAAFKDKLKKDND